MALIAHRHHAASLSHDGVDYTADERGVIDVPDHVANHLLRFPHWSPVASTDPTDDTDVAALKARIAELEAGLPADPDAEPVDDKPSRRTARSKTSDS